MQARLLSLHLAVQVASRLLPGEVPAPEQVPAALGL